MNTASAVLPGSGRLARAFPLSLSGVLSLSAIVAVLVTVSIPRLRLLARQENEADARATASLLARALVADPMRGAPTLSTLLEREEYAGVRTDAEFFPHEEVLRRHGYLFELVVLGPRGNPGAERAVRAWPWKHGSTGAHAFLALGDGTIFEHPNPDAAWNGLSSAGAGRTRLVDWQ